MIDISSISWATIGTALAGISGSALAYFQGRGGRIEGAAKTNAAVSEYAADATVSNAAAA